MIVFNPFPNLNTSKYSLRRPLLEDAKEIFSLRSDKHVNEFLDRTIAKTIDDARKFIAAVNNSISENNAIYWIICPKDKSNVLGTICLWNISIEKYSADIGFELLPEYQGKGIMREVLPVIIQYGFEELKLKSINGEVDPRNVKSIKLMEKNGFKLKETLGNYSNYTLKQ
jgi:ribosomal-protein-alanine N-acetyltransferase